MEVRLPNDACQKTGELSEGQAGPLLSLRLSRVPGGRGSPTRGLQPDVVDGSTPSLLPIPPTLVGGGGGCGWVDLSGHSWMVWGTQLGIAQKGLFPVGGRLSFFLPAWQRITSDKFVMVGYQTGVHPPVCEASPFVSVSCGDTIAKAAVQTTGAVGRGFIPPQQEGRGDCRFVLGPGGILFPLLPGHQAHWWVLPHPQPTRPLLIYSSCQVPHGDPHFNSSRSSQRLVDGVAESHGRLFACTDTPQSLAVSSVCSQEPGRGAHCLSTESSPFWLSHCPQSFYQTHGSVSSIRDMDGWPLSLKYCLGFGKSYGLTPI